MSWALDWGKGPHRHHHSTRKRLGAMKLIRKVKTMPRGAAGTFATRLKRWFRRYWSNLSRNANSSLKNLSDNFRNPLK